MKSISRRVRIMLLILFVLACVIRAPVSLMTLFLPQTIQFKNVDGSLWTGRASAIGIGGRIVQEQVAWQFRPQALLSGCLAWRVSGSFGKNVSQLTLEFRPGGAELADVSVFLPLEPLVALHPKLKALQFGALLHATAGRLSLQASSKASVDVDQLFSAQIPQAGPLGRYRMDVEVAADGKGVWTLSSLPGNLAASGQGQLDLGRSLINGQVVLTPSASIPGLSPLLTQLPKAGDGYLVTL